MFYRVSAIYIGKHFVFMAEFIISFCCAFFHLISYLQHYNLEVARGNDLDIHFLCLFVKYCSSTISTVF